MHNYLKSLCVDVHIKRGEYDDNIYSWDCLCLLVLVYLPFNKESKLLGGLMWSWGFLTKQNIIHMLISRFTIWNLIASPFWGRLESCSFTWSSNRHVIFFPWENKWKTLVHIARIVCTIIRGENLCLKSC